MAAPPKLTLDRLSTATVRLAVPEVDELLRIVFSRYPDKEWACFARFGWRVTPDALLMTLAAIDGPGVDDLDATVGHIAFSEPYTLRTALSAEKHSLAIGVIHSHPANCWPAPSLIDDDMDAYFSRYFADFAPDRPYVSLILSRNDGELCASARVFWRGKWLRAMHILVERMAAITWSPSIQEGQTQASGRHARLVGALGVEAAGRLRRSCVGIVGAGGTGSAAIEVLARAGIGKLIIVDPDYIEESNLERIHGSLPRHATTKALKVAVARDHARAIDPDCEVLGIVGALPQREVIDALVSADVVLGCSDSHHSRLALGDLAVRYLVPAIDCAVTLEGRGGRITGQIAQFTRFLAADPCPLCRRMVTPERLGQELMSPAEQQRRKEAAEDARERGENPDAYWHTERQLNTVGFHTTMVGAVAAGYAIGWITGRFDTPFSCIQMNLVAPLFEVIECERESRSACACRRIRGWADQANADAFITAPAHWPPARRIEEFDR